MKLFHVITCCIAFATAAAAQSTIGLSPLGQTLDLAGVLRPVHGLAGNFILGDPSATNVLSAACGPQFCLLKTDDQLLIVPSNTNEPVAAQTSESVPTGPAIFAFRADTAQNYTAWIYYPQTATLTHFTDSAEPATPIALNGEVLSMRATSHGLEFAVRRDGTVWIEAQDGSVLDSIPDADGPVLLLDNAILYASGDSVKLKRSNGNSLNFTIPNVQQISALSPHYAQLTARDHLYALKLDQGHEFLSQLPEPQSQSHPVRRR